MNTTDMISLASELEYEIQQARMQNANITLPTRSAQLLASALLEAARRIEALNPPKEAPLLRAA